MPAYNISYYPEYKSLVTGHDDSNVYGNYYRGRRLRALSAIPDLGRVDRGTLVIPDLVQRSLSVARDIVTDPPLRTSFEYPQYWDTKDAIERSRRVIDRIDNYWLTRSECAVKYPDVNTYVSTRGKVYKILAPARRRFPSEYWAAYPYSSTLAPFYSYGKRYWNYYDPLYDNYVRTDSSSAYEPSSYYRSSYYLAPKRDVRLDYPYRSLEYRPSYGRYSRLRDSYLVLPQPATFRRLYY